MNPTPVQKRAGARRPVKGIVNPHNKATLAYFKENVSNARLFHKKQSDYRYVICTDLEPDDMYTLALFTAWYRTNERAVDASTVFPIYGMIVGESNAPEIKVKRAHEFMEYFADSLLWNDRDCNKWTSYNSSLSRIWFDSSSDRSFQQELDLVQNTDNVCVKSFSEGFLEIKSVKPCNLFFIYLKPLRFLQTPGVLEYLLKCPGVMYGSGNIRSVINDSNSNTLLRFLNRTADDAPLVYTEAHQVINNDRYVCTNEWPALFNMLEDAPESSIAEILRKVMYARNEDSFTRKMELLIKEPEFLNSDPDDHRGISRVYESLTPERKKVLEPLVQWILRMLQNDYKQIRIGDQLAFVGMLLGFNKSFEHPFKLQQSSIDYSGEYVIITQNSNARTYALLPKGNVTAEHVHVVKKLIVDMTRTAIRIIDE